MIVDDHPVLRHGLVALLEPEPWVGRLVEASTVSEATELAVTEHPDIAVVDLGLPDGTGLELIHKLRRSAPDCAILILTLTSEPHSVRACLNAGASGYVLKSTAPLSVVHAVRTVADGGLVLGPGARPGTFSGQRSAALSPPLDRLSHHDLRLLALVAEGGANPHIARTLGITEKTVRNRLSQILVKIGAADRVQAALLARDQGLTAAGLPR